MSDTIKECLYCGKEFTAKRATAKFDSAACKLKFNRGQEPKDEPIPEVPEKDIHEDHPELAPEVAPGRAYEVPEGTKGAKWRSVTTHPKGGYWVAPGQCKWGECLNPECKF